MGVLSRLGKLSIRRAGGDVTGASPGRLRVRLTRSRSGSKDRRGGAKIRTKLLASFAVVLVMTGLVGFVGVSQARHLRDSSTRAYTDDVVGMGQVAVLTRDVLENWAEVLKMAHETDLFSRAEIVRKVTILDSDVDQVLREIDAGDPDQTQATELKRFADGWIAYKLQRNGLVMSPAAIGLEERQIQNRLNRVQANLDEVKSSVDALISGKRADGRDSNAENIATYGRAWRAIAAMSLVAILLGVAIAVFLSARFARRTKSVATAAGLLTAGDLSARAEVHTRDEMGAMAAAFNSMAERLEETVESDRHKREELQQAVEEFSLFAERVAAGDLASRLAEGSEGDLRRLSENLNRMAVGLGDLSAEVRESAQSVGTAAEQILATVSQHTSSATEQSAALSQTATTVDEVRTAAEQAALRAQEVATLAQSAVTVGEEGTSVVGGIVSGMTEIRDKVETIAQDILALSEQTAQIGEITTTVNDLADQSNMLALNAAIEAAKAGEQGKGFAVVATEVRSLAEQSKQATAQVQSILSEIQKGTNAAVLATEEGTRVVEEGVSLVQRAGEVIAQLAETIRETAQAAQQISASAHEQRVGMEQISQGMQDVSQVTAQFVAAAQQTQVSAEGLNQLARTLNRLTENYRV